MTTQSLPTSDCFFRPDGTPWRRIRYVAADGTDRVRFRPINLESLEAARRDRSDFYHPTLGWIIEGVAREKEYETEEVMADVSMSELIDPDRTAQNVQPSGTSKTED